LGNSTIPLQYFVDDAMTYSEIKPVLQASQTANAALSIGNSVMNYMLSQNFPWKFNELIIPNFYSNSYQQDYAVPGVTNLAWLQRGTVVDINNTSVPKPRFLVEVGRSLPQLTSASLTVPFISNPKFVVNFYPNDQLYYGVWGGSSSSTGNDPVANSVYSPALNPGSSQPSNPTTQIKDANGNLLVLTGYGHEGTTAPVAPANSAAGTIATPGSGATTQWTVVDPKGQGFRVAPVPTQTGTEWQFNLVGQMRPPRFVNLQQLIDPIPDDYSEYFRQGFIANCYLRSPEEKTRRKGDAEYALWQKALVDARMKSDRERDEYGFVVDPLISGGVGQTTSSPAWPYGGPPPGVGF
jgi:hypothetical protein